MIFGKKIKELREEHGMVQRKLAAALDIDTPMYSKIERGETKKIALPRDLVVWEE